MVLKFLASGKPYTLNIDADMDLKSYMLFIDARVDAGGRLVDSAGVTMEEIVASVSRVVELMREISSASKEQSDGIAQVNTAIAQMDGTTQQNAALVEQAAAAAQSRQEQATALTRVVSVFRLDDTGPAPALAGRLKQEPVLVTS